MAQHIGSHHANGMAALGICESLLLTLIDLKIITEKEAADLLTDVATAHTEAAASSPTPDKHHAVVAIVEHMLVGKNWRQH